LDDWATAQKEACAGDGGGAQQKWQQQSSGGPAVTTSAAACPTGGRSIQIRGWGVLGATTANEIKSNENHIIKNLKQTIKTTKTKKIVNNGTLILLKMTSNSTLLQDERQEGNACSHVESKQVKTLNDEMVCATARHSFRNEINILLLFLLIFSRILLLR